MLFFNSLIWAASCHRETRFSWQGDVLSCLACIDKSYKNCFFNFIFLSHGQTDLCWVYSSRSLNMRKNSQYHHHNQDTGQFHHSPHPPQNKSSLLYPFTGIPCLCPKPLAYTDVLHHYSFLPFKECPINGITQFIPFETSIFHQA